MEEFLTGGGWIPVITAVVQAIKTGVSERFYRFLPIVSIVVGAIAVNTTSGLSWWNTWVGVVYGLAGAGLFDFTKRTLLDVKSVVE